MLRKNVILFGAGNMLEEAASFLSRRRVRIIAICDNDIKKVGSRIHNKKVITPNILKKIPYDYIVVSNEKYQTEILEQLDSMGIKCVIPIFAETFTSYQRKAFNEISSYTGKVRFLKRRIELRKRKIQAQQDFFPTKLGIWFNPYYFARRNIANKINKYSNLITGKCMDFGCGSKPYEKLFETDEYYGVEIESDSKINGITYYDGKHLPFENDYFDSIVSFQVFEHVINLDEIVVELNRVLKKGGYMLISVPFLWAEHLKPYDYRRFSSFGIQEYLKKNGFEIIAYEKCGNFIEAIFQMKNVFINETLFLEKGTIFRKLLCSINNIMGCMMSEILPQSKDLYLDNILLVRKE